MVELLSRLDGEELMVGIVTIGVLVTVIVVATASIVAATWVRLRERQLAASVILEMLDQQMSVDEIERVLKAAGFGDRGTPLSELLQKRHAARPS